MEGRSERTRASILRRLLHPAFWFGGPILRFRAQGPAGSRCRPNAASTYPIKVGASKGLVKKHVAPPFIARVRTVASGNALMKTNGTVHPRPRRHACNSIPSMTGIRTSVITQAMSHTSADCNRSPADANVQTEYPRDLKRLSVAARMDASSSTTAINTSADGCGRLTQCILAPADAGMRGLGVSER